MKNEAEQWNADCPVGTRVVVVRDNGEEWETVTRSPAWMLYSRTAVVKVEGITGCYLLSRVHPFLVEE